MSSEGLREKIAVAVLRNRARWRHLMADRASLVPKFRPATRAVRRGAWRVAEPSHIPMLDPALQVRPRGLECEDPEWVVDGQPAPATIVDLATAFATPDSAGRWFVTPELVSCEEALWIADVLGDLEVSPRAIIAIQTWPAAFEVDEIVFALRRFAVGLSVDRDRVAAWRMALAHGAPSASPADPEAPLITAVQAEVAAVAKTRGLRLWPEAGPNATVAATTEDARDAALRTSWAAPVHRSDAERVVRSVVERLDGGDEGPNTELEALAVWRWLQDHAPLADGPEASVGWLADVLTDLRPQWPQGADRCHALCVRNAPPLAAMSVHPSRRT